MLLVFNQAHVVRIIKAQLEELGCSVSSACDAESALALLHQANFTAAIIAFDLPGMNGIQLCMNINRQIHQDPPRLFLSGISQTQLESENTDWPVRAECLEWPISVATLIQSLVAPQSERATHGSLAQRRS